MAENQGQDQQSQADKEDISANQRRGIFKAIQAWFNRLGFGDEEIRSADDPNILGPTSQDKSDPFLDTGLRTISTYNASWRQKDDIEGEEEKSGYLARDNRYRDYKQMIREPELEAGLMVHADEATQTNENDDVFEIVSENSKIKDMLERLFFEKLNLNVRKCWEIIFEMVWMGDAFYLIYLDKNTQKEILKLERLKPEDVERKEKNGKLDKFLYKGQDIEPVQMIHFRNKSIRFGNYGASILEAGRSVWKQLKLLEEAVVIYRVTRAPERKIFYIDVGQVPPDKAEGIIERFKMRFQKKRMLDVNSGKVDTVANVMSYNESFYIPRVMGRDNSELTTLPSGAPNAGDIDDLAYFKEKLLATLHMPPEYVGYSGGQDSGGGTTAGKYLSEQDIRFSRIISRLQSNFEDGLKKVAMIYLGLNGISFQEAQQFKIKMTKPSAAEELKRIDVQGQIYNLIGAIKGLDMFPDVWIMNKILNLDDDEIAEIVQLMRIQRAQLDPQAMAGGSPTSPFPGEIGPEPGGPAPGGADASIPVEVDQALQGAPGAVGQGAAEQMSAMLNAMENEIRDEEEAKKQSVEKDKKEPTKDEIKKRILKKRIKNKIANIRESLSEGKIDDNSMEELLELQSAYSGGSKKRTDEKLNWIVSEMKEAIQKRQTKSVKIRLEDVEKPLKVKNVTEDVSITSKSWYKLLTEGKNIELFDVNFSMKQRAEDSDTVLDILEKYFGTHSQGASRKERRGYNNYLRELLLDGELKSSGQESNMNVVQILKDSMSSRNVRSDDEHHIHGMLLEEIEEQINSNKKQKKTNQRRKK